LFVKLNSVYYKLFQVIIENIYKVFQVINDTINKLYFSNFK